MEQMNFFSNIDTTNSIKYNAQAVECLFNGERGMHTFKDMRISKSQYETTLVVQEDAYRKYIGRTVGDFDVLAIEYDWGTHKQVWTVRCNTCGEISYKPDGYQWSRGKMYSMQCKKCRIYARDERIQREEEEKRLRKERRDAEIREKTSAELHKMYGKFEVVEYKGHESCKVKCVECGAVRTKNCTISNLQNGIYPRCDCGRPKYGDGSWIGKRVGHLTVNGHEGHHFICRCDCGRERIVIDSYFAQKRYRDCGSPECEYIEEAKSRSIAAKMRGNAYEGIAEAVIISGGYKTKHVGKTGDYGVDIIAEDSDGMAIAVQCKSNMSKTVGVEAVQQVYAGGRYYGLEHFAVMSHSGYSVQAVKMAKKLGVYLSDGKTFIYPDNMKKYADGLIPTYNVQKHIKAQKLYEMNGVKKTLPNWAFEYGTSVSRVKAGLKKGLTLENALKYNPAIKRTYTYKGFTGTVAEICREFNVGVTSQTIYNRINKGMSIDEAINFQPHIGRPTKEYLTKTGQKKLAPQK